MPTAAPPLSNSFANRVRRRATLILWVVAALLAAGVTAALLNHRGERDHVSEYVEQVNDVQKSFALRFGSVNQVYERFRFSTADIPTQLPKLRAAAREVTILRGRIEGIDAPEAAEDLRRLLIRYFRQQELIAKELVDVTTYLRTLAGAEREVALANRSLQRKLRSAAGADAQTAVVLSYARNLNEVARRLDGTTPPSLLAPAQAAYVRQLRNYATATRGLERAVAADDRAGTEASLRRLRVAGSASPATLRAQRVAIAAYNKRVQSIRRFAVAVEKERRRLELELG